MRGFIDDLGVRNAQTELGASQSAFVRGFIDDASIRRELVRRGLSLNPRSCAASSMT